MIALENLTIHAHNFFIQDITLRVLPGEIHALIGPSGAGKTLILETIAGLFKPLKGKILIDQVDVTSYPPLREDPLLMCLRIRLFSLIFLYGIISFME